MRISFLNNIKIYLLLVFAVVVSSCTSETTTYKEYTDILSKAQIIQTLYWECKKSPENIEINRVIWEKQYSKEDIQHAINLYYGADGQ